MTKPKYRKGKVELAFEQLRSLHCDSDFDAGVVYLPTSHLSCPVEEFKAALERHGMLVEPVEGLQAFRVQGPPFTLPHLGYCANYNDRYNWTEKGVVPEELLEFRILPYLLEDQWQSFVALSWLRPVLPTDDLKRIRTQAWPLLESAGPADDSPAVKQMYAQEAEKLRIANLDLENAQLRREVERLQGLLAAQV